MIYEVNARLIFANEDESKDFFHDCQLALGKTAVVNPGRPDAEYSSVQRILSNHDLDPNEESIVLESDTTAPSP